MKMTASAYTELSPRKLPSSENSVITETTAYFPCSHDSPSGHILNLDAKPYFAISFLILSYNKNLGFPRGFFV
jgi:hypothetical protein